MDATATRPKILADTTHRCSHDDCRRVLPAGARHRCPDHLTPAHHRITNRAKADGGTIIVGAICYRHVADLVALGMIRADLVTIHDADDPADDVRAFAVRAV